MQSNAMNNTMQIKGHTALISVDPDTAQFRGEFIGLNGGAEFYGASVKSLHKEGARSLMTFLDVCKERDIAPYR